MKSEEISEIGKSGIEMNVEDNLGKEVNKMLEGDEMRKGLNKLGKGEKVERELKKKIDEEGDGLGMVEIKKKLKKEEGKNGGNRDKKFVFLNGSKINELD